MPRTWFQPPRVPLARQRSGAIPRSIQQADPAPDSREVDWRMSTWVVVLVKDFESAKQGLGPAIDPHQRMVLARRNASRAIRAAGAAEHGLVVAGSDEAAALAAELGAEVLIEPRQEGQNVAAQRGLARATQNGADAVLLLSSDLPLVTKKSVRDLLREASRLAPPVAVAVPATGRGRTNALYLHPPPSIGLHFAADSLPAFPRHAAGLGVRFEIHISPAMALDLDEPADLARLRRAVCIASSFLRSRAFLTSMPATISESSSARGRSSNQPMCWWSRRRWCLNLRERSGIYPLWLPVTRRSESPSS